MISMVSALHADAINTNWWEKQRDLTAHAKSVLCNSRTTVQKG